MDFSHHRHEAKNTTNKKTIDNERSDDRVLAVSESKLKANYRHIIKCSNYYSKGNIL